MYSLQGLKWDSKPGCLPLVWVLNHQAVTAATLGEECGHHTKLKQDEGTEGSLETPVLSFFAH